MFFDERTIQSATPPTPSRENLHKTQDEHDAGRQQLIYPTLIAGRSQRARASTSRTRHSIPNECFAPWKKPNSVPDDFCLNFSDGQQQRGCAKRRMAGPPLGRSGSANKANMLAADDAKRMQMLESKITEQKKELEVYFDVQ